MASRRRYDPGHPSPQDGRPAGQPGRTGRAVRASGAGAGCGTVSLSAAKETDHGAQHAGDDLALAIDRPGSQDHSWHDRGIGEEQVPGQAMIVLPYIGFAVLALAAIGFATWTVWRRKDRAHLLLAGAVGLFLLGVGGGTYWMVGQPGLAIRAAQGLNIHTADALIPYLIDRVRKNPADSQAWAYLGRAYISTGDAEDAAKALGRAVAVSPRPDANLESTYGMVLVAAGNGQVSDEAAKAFQRALAVNPKDIAARLYLGEALASRNDKQGALALWQSLLADIPNESPLHQQLVDRIAMLTAQTIAPGGAAPDPRQMVAMLAARLKDSPNDAAGWQRLIKAYTVLGETAKAKDALATARKTFAGHQDLLAALDAEAKDL